MPKQHFSRFVFLMGIFEVGFGLIQFLYQLGYEPAYARRFLAWRSFLSAGFLIGGIILLVMMRYALSDQWRRLLAALAALPVAFVAISLLSLQGWPGVLVFGTMAIMTAAFPWLPPARLGNGRHGERDLLDLVFSAQDLMIGLVMLGAPELFAVPQLVGLFPHLRWVGAALIAASALILLPGSRRWPLSLRVGRLTLSALSMLIGIELGRNGSWASAYLCLCVAVTLGLVPVRPRAESESPSGEGALDPLTGTERVAETWSWLMVVATVLVAFLEDPADGRLMGTAGGFAAGVSAYNIFAYWLFSHVGTPQVRINVHLVALTLAAVPILFQGSAPPDVFMIVLVVPPILAARAVGERLSYLLLGLGVGILVMQEYLHAPPQGGHSFLMIKVVLLVAVGLVAARNAYQQRTLALLLRSLQQDLCAANQELAAQSEELKAQSEELVEQRAKLLAQNEDLERAAAALTRLADYDPLTGLLNRRGFGQRMAAELQRAELEGGQGAVAFLDLDQFKFINDRLGHHVGDMVLQKVAVVLSEQARDAYVVARLGGDEFAMLMPGVDAREARERATHLLQSLREAHLAVQGEVLTVSASIGVTLYPAQGTSSQELLVNADMAMYAAKESGRNAAHLFGHCDDENSPGDLFWDREIRAALDEHRFVLHFQPIMDLQTGEVTRHEALLRMIGRDGEEISPYRFLPAAERSPLIHRIDRWVVSEAIRVLGRHREDAAWMLEVNLSGRAFEDPGLLPFIAGQLREHRVSPSALTLEITETAAISDMPRATEFVESLRKLGCRFAIDDFGAGFSSFAYLKHLRVDYLKIDGGFIRELPLREQDQHLVRAMASMARALGVQTIAEWVGDADTVELLKQSGIDFAQGYWVGRPSAAPAAGADAARSGEFGTHGG